MVHRRDVPVSAWRSTRWDERCVSTLNGSSMSIPPHSGVRVYDTQGVLLPIPHTSAIHCPSIVGVSTHPIRHRGPHCIRAAVSFITQTGTPPLPNPFIAYMTPLVSQHAATDLASLSSISDDVIGTCLHKRFMTDAIYSIKFSARITVNPYKYVASNADSILQNTPQTIGTQLRTRLRSLLLASG